VRRKIGIFLLGWAVGTIARVIRELVDDLDELDRRITAIETEAIPGFDHQHQQLLYPVEHSGARLTSQVVMR
jgi:hypothetical protein